MFQPTDRVYRAWHLTGDGFERLRPVTLPRPKIGPDEILLHQRVVTICYSSIKVLLSGNAHPRLAGRDLERDPVVLGDECFGVVAEVGENLRGRFRVGDAVAVSPDLDVDAYGYGVPGGVQQLNVIRGKMLDFLLKVPPDAVSRYGMFAMPLSEPLACVERALSLEYRTAPKPDGRTLAIPPFPLPPLGGEGQGEGWKTLADKLPRKASGQAPAAHGQETFDDVLVTSSRPEVIRRAVEWATPRLSRFGVLALLGKAPAGCKVRVDLGRAHYQRTLVVGSDRADAGDAYSRNTAFGLRPGCTVLLLGAGGPMGQFFLMRCVAEKKAGPARVLAAEILPSRVENLRRLVSRLDTAVEVEVVDVSKEPARIKPGIRGVDYLVLLCSDVEALERWLPGLNDNAVINAFAGLSGSAIMMEARDVTTRGIRVIGHSGSTLGFQERTLAKIVSGEVDVAPVVASVGGFNTVREALESAYAGKYPGKTVIYLDVDHPLVTVDSLTGGGPWSAAEERRFLNGKA